MSLLGPQLEAFIAVAKHKSVHRAADEIFITQTAVTQRIRALERTLHSTLFVRTRRGMLLTPEGEALLHYCQAAKELEGEALAKIQGAGLQTEIRLTITAPNSIMQARVIPSCLLIIKKFPNLLINFTVNDIENRHQALRAGLSDFAIIQEEQLAAEMEFKRLKPEQYLLVCSYKWQNRTLREIIKNERIIDFDSTDQCTFNYLKQYDLFDIAKHSRYFVNRTENLALLVSEGIGYTTLAKEFAAPYIKNKKLIILNKNKTYNITPILAWYDRPAPPKYFSAIIDAIG
ncbi:MAG: LysR family transcriptional regulator [Gammaproteobacteria bacterium]|jgi:DNA-binding transcriptional LysR family regulator